MILKELKHPNIVRYLSSWKEDIPAEEQEQPNDWSDSSNSSDSTSENPPIGNIFINMELCSMTLKLRIKSLCLQSNKSPSFYRTLHNKENVPVQTSISPLKIILQLSDALVYIHERGIVHRDLTLNKIFLNSNDVVKLGDFGLSKVVPMSNRMSSAGNFLYSAPEMDDPQEWPLELNLKTDVFGLGMIFFELVFSMFGFVELAQNCREHDKLLGKLRKAEKSISLKSPLPMHHFKVLLPSWMINPISPHLYLFLATSKHLDVKSAIIGNMDIESDVEIDHGWMVEILLGSLSVSLSSNVLEIITIL